MDATPFDTTGTLVVSNEDAMILKMHRGRHFSPEIRTIRGREYLKTNIGKYTVVVKLPLKEK